MRAQHVYVHIPFCARRCSYCDFAIAVRSHVPVAEYLEAMARELELRFGHQSTQPAATLYLGGGTPSSLGGDGIAELVNNIQRYFPLEPGAEVTLEANPEDVTDERALAWRANRINRVSLGAQSFDENALRWMRRAHDAIRVACATEAIERAGIDNWSLDLIFALPAAIGRSWRSDLERALELNPRHVSLYGLSVEPNTAVARWKERGLVIESTDESYEEEFLLADELLRSRGFDHYEVSNYARDGYRGRHNSGYWSGASYVGLGPSAHGYDGLQRRWNERAYTTWLAALREGRDPMAGEETLTAENRATESVYLGLRTTNGLELQADEGDLARQWERSGWARIDGPRLVLTPSGWVRLDALAAALTKRRSR